MNKNEWTTLNDGVFEELLKNSVSEPPPENIVADITPWKKSIHRILLGMVLSTITLNFLCLNYILPAIGMIFSISGFRTLHKENKWFHGCFIIITIRSIYLFSMLILNTTIYRTSFPISAAGSILSVISLGLFFIQLFFLRNAFREVQQKAGLSLHSGSLVILIIWYAVIFALGLIPYEGPIILGIMFIGYICIIRSLHKLSTEISKIGYTICPAPIRISEQGIVNRILVILAIGGICGYLFGGSYPMAWTPFDTNEHNEVQDIKTQLTELGFPEHILNDMSAEDIAACEGALQIFVEVREHTVHSDNVATTNENDKDLRITGIGLRLPDEQETWIIIQHFEWMTNPGFHGTESIQLQPAYDTAQEGWNKAGEITGRVLYTNNGISYTAPYHSLGEQTYLSSNMFFGENTVSLPFATFSFPNNGERCRGYVSYRIVKNMYYSIIYSCFNYTHQKSQLQYPVLTAMEHRMSNKWEIHTPFQTIQDALDFYPKDADAKLD